MARDREVRGTRFRRSLDRKRTAQFIAVSDLAIFLVVIGTVFVGYGGLGTLAVFPWSVVAGGSVALLLRMFLLLLLVGAVQQIVGATFQGIRASYTWIVDTIGDGKISIDRWEWADRLARDDHSTIDHHLAWWAFLVGFGIVAQMVIVAGSGGMATSPFAQFLITTFVLGQFRSPTGRAIWALFFSGIACAALAHVLYIILHHFNPADFDSLQFSGTSLIAPGILVAFVSTLVYWVTFRTEAASILEGSGLPPPISPIVDGDDDGDG